MELSNGTLLAERYEILAPISRGGMGAVYRAADRHFKDRTVALKQMLDDSGSASHERFQAEADTVVRLNHPSIPRMLDHFMVGEAHFLVMEFIHGDSLDRLLEQSLMLARQPLPPEHVMRIALDVCDVLSYLHRQNPPLVHRDIKPGNIIVRYGDNRTFLVDFGVARQLPRDNAAPKTMVGTMGYAPLEQVSGRPELRSDIYALGATMYHLLSGEMPTPFEVGPLSDVAPHLPASLAAIVARATAKVPAMRYENVEVMARDLRAALSGLVGSGTPGGVALSAGELVLAPPSPPTGGPTVLPRSMPESARQSLAAASRQQSTNELRAPAAATAVRIPVGVDTNPREAPPSPASTSEHEALKGLRAGNAVLLAACAVLLGVLAFLLRPALRHARHETRVSNSAEVRLEAPAASGSSPTAAAPVEVRPPPMASMSADMPHANPASSTSPTLSRPAQDVPAPVVLSGKRVKFTRQMAGIPLILDFARDAELTTHGKPSELSLQPLTRDGSYGFSFQYNGPRIRKRHPNFIRHLFMADSPGRLTITIEACHGPLTKRKRVDLIVSQQAKPLRLTVPPAYRELCKSHANRLFKWATLELDQNYRKYQLQVDLAQAPGSIEFNEQAAGGTVFVKNIQLVWRPR